jgi:hypothetical protein
MDIQRIKKIKEYENHLFDNRPDTKTILDYNKMTIT